jgi:hypothetical protein
MIKKLIENSKSKSLKIFAVKRTEFGTQNNFKPEISAERISERLINDVKINLSQHLAE